MFYLFGIVIIQFTIIIIPFNLTFLINTAYLFSKHTAALMGTTLHNKCGFVSAQTLPLERLSR